MARNSISASIIAVFSLLAALSAVAQPLPQIELRPVFTNLTLTNPVGLLEAPDNSGRLFIIGQDGIILAVPKTGGLAKTFLDMTSRQTHASYEEGLLGVAFHPQFKSNGLFYVFYSQQNPRRSVVSEWTVATNDPDAADLKSERILMEIPQPDIVHKAGQIAFGPDGCLYIAVGDGGGQNDPYNTGQNLSLLRGKILRIDVNSRSASGVHGNETKLAYGIPRDNPFVGEPEMWENGVRKEIWAYGFRNPWRFSFDRETGQLWAGDVGQDTWEEINLVVNGGNYGWSVREGAHHFKPGPEGARYIDPVVEYPHKPELMSQSISPDHDIGMCVIGGYVYRGAKYPALRGVYIYGDFVLGTIWGFRYLHGQVMEHGTMLKQPKNITSFGEDREGELYVLAYDGHIYSIAVPDGK